MVDNEYYWRDFVKEVQIQLNSLIKQLHLAYERRNDCIYNIKDNLAKYQEAGVDVSVVFDIEIVVRFILIKNKMLYLVLN